MSWYTQREYDQHVAAVRDMPQPVRDALTWEAAVSYVLIDTLTLAAWSGLSQRREGTPYDALCWMYGLAALSRPERPAGGNDVEQ